MFILQPCGRTYVIGSETKGGIMTRRNRAVVVLLAVAALIAVSSGMRAQLTLAFENRADPNPRQVALGVELAGLCLGIVISWSERLRSTAY